MNNKLIHDGIERMLDLLDSPEKWAQGSVAYSEWGASLADGRSPQAVSWCLLGAAQKVCGPMTCTAVHQYLNMCNGGNIVMYNDSASTTYEDVRLMLKSAMHALEK